MPFLAYVARDEASTALHGRLPVWTREEESEGQWEGGSLSRRHLIFPSIMPLAAPASPRPRRSFSAGKTSVPKFPHGTMFSYAGSKEQNGSSSVQHCGRDARAYVSSVGAQWPGAPDECLPRQLIRSYNGRPLRGEFINSLAKFWLLENLHGLGGGKREGGRAPPPARPPRNRHANDNLEKLRRCTKLLKSSNAEEKPEEGDEKKKGREGRVRAFLTRQHSLGKISSKASSLSTEQHPRAQSQESMVRKAHPASAPETMEHAVEVNESKESIVSLSPPKPWAEIAQIPRIIPFRSASVTHVDTNKKGRCTSLRLHPVCKDYKGSNTLPRPKQASGKSVSISHNEPIIHPPLSGSTSLADVAHLSVTESPTEKLENKSKSESELSFTAFKKEGRSSNPFGQLLEAVDSTYNVEVKTCAKRLENTNTQQNLMMSTSWTTIDNKEVEIGTQESPYLESKSQNDQNSGIKFRDNNANGNNFVVTLPTDTTNNETLVLKELRANMTDSKEISSATTDVLSSFITENKSTEPVSEGLTSQSSFEDTLNLSKIFSQDVDLDYKKNNVREEDNGGNDKNTSVYSGVSSLGDEPDLYQHETEQCAITEKMLVNENGILNNNDKNIHWKNTRQGSEGQQDGSFISDAESVNSLVFASSNDTENQNSRKTSIGAEDSDASSKNEKTETISIRTPGIGQRPVIVVKQIPKQDYYIKRVNTLNDMAEVREYEYENTRKTEPVKRQYAVVKSASVGSHLERRLNRTSSQSKEECLKILMESIEAGLDNPKYRKCYVTQVSDEGISVEDSRIPVNESSDSSSQDSVGLGHDKSDEGIVSGGFIASVTHVSTTFSKNHDQNITFRDSGLNRLSDQNALEICQISPHQNIENNYVDNSDKRSVSVSSVPVSRDLKIIDSAERKKKHYSDPSCEISTSSHLYLAESNFEPVLGKSSRNDGVRITSPSGVMSQASTDSEGKDEKNIDHVHSFHPFTSQGTITFRFFSPQVILSGNESDGSQQDSSGTDLFQPRSASRNVSPCPYQDSDSGDRSAPRSPHGPRRYSKRPLRGPYGEMLEAEMSKSKSSSFLSDDKFLYIRESKSASPRPPSPGSVTHRSASSIPSAHSMDDSSLRLLFKSSDKPTKRKTTPSSPDGIMTCESDCERTLSPIESVHQRTISSPSKLFFEQGFNSEEEPELSEFSFHGAHDLTEQHKPYLECPPSVILQYKHHQDISEEVPKVNQALQTEHRFTPEHRHSHKRHRDTRAHVVGELYDTERHYVENLKFLLTRYQQYLKGPEGSGLIDVNLVDDIFFQVPEILGHHERFLQELKKRQEEKDSFTCVGDIVLQLERRKEHPGKLDLKCLLIKPVQRFPHYELLLKRLIKHTSRDHPDYPLLTEAISEVQNVASRINAVEQEALQQEHQQFLLKEIASIIEGLDGLVQPDRLFLQHDHVTLHSAMGTRKEICIFLFTDLLVMTTVKRRTGTIRKASNVALPLLNSLEANKFKLYKVIPLDEVEIARYRDESLKMLEREIETLEGDLQTLDEINKLVRNLRWPGAILEESVHEMETCMRKQLTDRQSSDSQLNNIELNITTQEGVDSLTLCFHGSEKRTRWEELFNGAKQKFAQSADHRPPPEFLTVLPIRKTRAGLQFTCASATLGLNAHSLRDVWVCSSDGYVGQVCVLSLQPEPIVVCCNGICNSRILSIASVPASPHVESSDDDEDDEIDDELRRRRSESLPPPDFSSEEKENNQPTMWLGTEDGFIHVYNCTDTIRIKKNRYKFQPGSPVHCIIHLDNRVFASLANGSVVVYRRDSTLGWNVSECHVVAVSTAVAPVTKMMALSGKLWCAAMNNVKILNTNTLHIEDTFSVGSEKGRGVACMASAGHGVWIAMHNSSFIRLYNAMSFECVCEVNVGPAVAKMLSGCDDIIRQHKSACLRVTALLACKDLLWVGTSAGVVVTLPLPHLSHDVKRIQGPLNVTAVPHGHTGHVRFLTCVELSLEGRPSRFKSRQRHTVKGKEHVHHQPGTAAPVKLLVISGGDGYEDFRSSCMSETAGRDDSINHLLFWQV